MNLWKCGAPDCNSSAVGIGGAVGLRAIGWHIEISEGINPPIIICPKHNCGSFLYPGHEVVCQIQAFIERLEKSR